MMLGNKIWGSIIVILCIPLTLICQQFRYAAPLDSILVSGFYSVTISPALSAHIKTDFADIRIADKNKHWIPHIIQQGITLAGKDALYIFPIIQNKVTDSGENVLIVENTRAGGIYNLKLFLKNAAVSRTAILSGSDDLDRWYIIDDNILISRSYENIKDEYLQEISFPLVKYRYLKININNRHNDPLNITKAGFYATPNQKKPGVFLDNPAPAFTQTVSINDSYIDVKQNEAFHFDRISLVISGARFYSRDIEIRLPFLGKNNSIKMGKPIAGFKLMSALPAIFEIPKTNVAHFFIVIKNADNPPLKIEKIALQQKPVLLIAYLEQGRTYGLVFGDASANFGDYDLKPFKDSIAVLRSLNYGPIHAIEKETASGTTNKNWLIWTLVIIAIIVLSYMAYRLANDIHKAVD